LCPTLQQCLIVQAVYFCSEGPAAIQHALLLALLAGTTFTPTPSTKITTRTCRQCHQNVLLSEEFEIVCLLGWAGFHEVLALSIQPGDLEDVDDVVNVKLAVSPDQLNRSRNDYFQDLR